jgi:hypothetical protein
VREIAHATWFASERPKTSGVGTDEKPTLQRLFPEKSRDQINRALRKADSSLAAALLAQPDLSWTDDLRAILEEQRKRGTCS